MKLKSSFLAVLMMACCMAGASEKSDHEKVDRMLAARRQANPAWVRAQTYPPFSKNAPADFFTDPAELEAQRQRGTEMVKAVAAAIRAGKRSYTLEPGEYRIAGNQGWAFIGVENFTIDGSGARIWFERNEPNDTPMRLSVSHCNHITFKNLQFDFDPSVFIQGTIEKISEDRKTIEMKIDPAWPKVSVPGGAFTIYTPDGKYVHQAGGGMHHGGATLFDGDKLRIEISAMSRVGDLTPNFDEDRLAFFGNDYAVKTGYLIGLNYRSAHAVTIIYSEKITLENVDIWQSPGGGIYEEYGGGGNVFRRVRLIRKPGTRRIHCGTADHFHSRAQQNGPQMIECEAGYTSDDIINIYGSWRWLLKQEDAKTVLVASAVPLGEKLTFYERGELKYIDEADVESIEEVKDQETMVEVNAMQLPEDARYIVTREPGQVFRVKLKTPVKKIDFPEVLIDAHSHNADGLLVKDCYFHDSFSRAQLFGGTVNAKVVNNIWDRMNAGICIYEESWAYSMGPAPQNVTFSGNTVMNMGAGSDAVTVGLVPKVVRLLNSQPSKNIVINDNLFVNSSGITMLYVNGGRIQNNTLVEPRVYERYKKDFSGSKMMFGHSYFPEERKTAISVWSCQNVEVSGNDIYYSGALSGFKPLDAGRWTRNVTDSKNRMYSIGKEVERFETEWSEPRTSVTH